MQHLGIEIQTKRDKDLGERYAGLRCKGHNLFVSLVNFQDSIIRFGLIVKLKAPKGGTPPPPNFDGLEDEKCVCVCVCVCG